MGSNWKSLVLVLGLLLSLFAPWSSFAKEKAPPSDATLHLSSFLSLFLSEREELSQAKADLQRARAELRVRSDFWATQLGVRPLLNHRLQENSSAGRPDLQFSEKLNTVSGELNQELPYGLTARFEGLKNILPPNENIPSQDYQYSGTLSMPLWRNAFGRLQKMEQSQAQLQVQSAEKEYENRLQDECLTGVQTYLDGFTQSERIHVAREKMKIAQEALRISERSWEKRLIREIDVLSARSNFLSTQIEWKLAEKEASVTLSNLYLTTQSLLEAFPDKSKLRLAPPSIEEVALLSSPNFETHPQIRSAQLSLEAARQGWQAERERRRSEVNLNIAAGASQGRTAGINFFNFNEEFLRVFLDIRLPINRRDAAAVESFYQQSLRQEAEVERLKKLLKIQWQDSMEQLEADRERLKWSKQSLANHRRRLERAQDLLRAGRMPFDEFIRYNESLFLEEERRLNLERDLLRHEVSLLLLSQKLPSVCERSDS